MRRDRRLADALAGADDADRRHADLLEPLWFEAKVGADVREAGRERTRRPAEALAGAEHRLVGEIDDELRVAEIREQRHAVARVAAQLLAPADEDRAHPVVRQLRKRVAHHLRDVLAVDQRDGSH